MPAGYVSKRKRNPHGIIRQTLRRALLTPEQSFESASSSRASQIRSSPVRCTTISIFPQGNRISIRRRTSGYKTAPAPPEPQVDDTSFETERDEDYEDVPHEDGAGECVGMVPKPETRPTKRSHTASKAAVSHHLELPCLVTDSSLF
jgi:hypothetical protein